MALCIVTESSVSAVGICAEARHTSWRARDSSCWRGASNARSSFEGIRVGADRDRDTSLEWIRLLITETLPNEKDKSRRHGKSTFGKSTVSVPQRVGEYCQRCKSSVCKLDVPDESTCGASDEGSMGRASTNLAVEKRRKCCRMYTLSSSNSGESGRVLPDL